MRVVRISAWAKASPVRCTAIGAQAGPQHPVICAVDDILRRKRELDADTIQG